MAIHLNSVYKWEKTVAGNYVLYIDDYRYISYNPDINNMPLSEFFAALVPTLSNKETALIDPFDADHEYRILSGDWRANYAQLKDKGFSACVEFFDSKKAEFGNQWSKHPKDRGL